MPRIELSQDELRVVNHLVAWALDQEHDSIEPDYFWFLVDEESGETVERVTALVNSAYDKLVAAL